ncbi:hypothetical protein ALI22I_06955 [Saccharothrix sp. ALI-22-I]|uniref:hypothetical protein n=1 Tax=Saccharothrix sp. ALI-22-I TaxID=1933778 RepID=UPI00097C4265|nr:hypothetical protein [Saccharothrix sp. ALI-22-I]ONI91815.1 hypothetical protein ALI22I_06955 [Saccharothrix sp. ALI-22-I]
MAGGQTARWIDATRLPEDIVALIDALGPGEDLLIKRDGKSIATISSTTGTFHAGIVDPGSRGDQAAERSSLAYENVTVVATAMKLSASARASLSAQLGPDYIVLDMNSAPKSVDVLLIPPVSPQLIGNLRSMFPKARVVIAEIEDKELGVSYQGPVRRLLNAGADVYVPPSTIPRLAEQLDRTMVHLRQITGNAGNTSTPLIIESSQDHNASEDE